MTTNFKFRIFPFVVFALVLFPRHTICAELIKVGSSRADVLRILGQPEMRTSADSLLSFVYGKTHIILENDRVIRYRVGQIHRDKFAEYPLSNGPKTNGIKSAKPAKAPSKPAPKAEPVPVKAPFKKPAATKPKPSAATAKIASPCDDSLYRALKKVSLDKMSDRQYNYFMQKDRQCYQTVSPGAHATAQSASPPPKKNPAKTALAVTSNTPVQVFLDDAMIGKTPVTLKLRCRAYRLSLFNSADIAAAWNEAEQARMKARKTGNKASRRYLKASGKARQAEKKASAMQSTRRKILLLPGKTKHVKYKIACEDRADGNCEISRRTYTISEENQPARK